MRSRGQVVSALLVLAVVAAGGVYLQREVGPRALAAGPVGVAPSGAWFCPHGGGTDWQVTLELANPGPNPVGVKVTELSGGKPSKPASFTVEPGTELQIPEAANARGASSMIEYFGGWVAAGWVAHAGGGETGVAAEPCIPQAGGVWYLPDGTTRENEDAYVVVMNPFAVTATISIVLYTDDGEPIRTGAWTNLVLKPHRSEAFHVNANALGYGTVSAVVDAATGRVVAATLGVSGLGGLRSSVGVLGDLPRQVILPGGFDQGRTDLVIMNPVGSRPTVTGAVLSADASQAIASLGQEGPNAASTQTYPVTTNGPSTIVLQSSSGVAVARRSYGVVSDQGSTEGASAPARAWVILPAVAGYPSHPGLVLANPGTESAEVTLSFLPAGTGPMPAAVTVVVPPGRTVAAPKAFVEAKPFAAVIAVASSGTFVPAAASYSLGREGFATYAVSLGVPVPEAWAPS